MTAKEVHDSPIFEKSFKYLLFCPKNLHCELNILPFLNGLNRSFERKRFCLLNLLCICRLLILKLKALEFMMVNTN